MKRLLLIIAVLLGCAPATAQTTTEKADQCYDFLRQKFPTEFPPGTTTGGTTTGGTTTGGTTTGGSTTGGTTTGGGTGYRTIFAQTEVNTNLLGWERCGNMRYPTGASTVTVLDNSAFAYAGQYCLQSQRPTGSTGMRLFQLGEYSSSCQRTNLPLETRSTFMIRVPQNYTGLSWLSVFGWKQEATGYNESTCYIWFSGSISNGLRLGVQGRTAGAAGTSRTVDYTHMGPNPSSPNTGHGQGFPINQWVRIDFDIKHDTANGYVKVYQNGTLIIHYIGRTFRENAPRVNAQLVNYGSGPATTIFFDSFELKQPL